MTTQKLLTDKGALNESNRSSRRIFLAGRLDAEPPLQARALLRQGRQGQGVFMMAKAKGGAAIAAASIDHLRRYIKLLFQPAMHRKKEKS